MIYQLASKEHAIFKQTDADVTSFDGGYGSAYLAKMVGQKKAREIFFLGRNYNAQEAFDMGMVNAVVPHSELETTAYEWAQEILAKSPISIKMLKFAMNLTDDGMVGQQVFAGEATRLAYMTDEAKEGRDAFLEKRKLITLIRNGFLNSMTNFKVWISSFRLRTLPLSISGILIGSAFAFWKWQYHFFISTINYNFITDIIQFCQRLWRCY